MDRLTPIDASFLHQEREASHMHVGGVVIFEGPPPSYQELVDHLISRVGSVPRYRQKLTEPPFELGRPFWIDDPSFNLDYHLRFTALPSPGLISPPSFSTSRRCRRRRPAGMGAPPATARSGRRSRSPRRSIWSRRP